MNKYKTKYLWVFLTSFFLSFFFLNKFKMKINLKYFYIIYDVLKYSLMVNIIVIAYS